jgi:myo-inositol-1(or 4)-monophosphatase
MLINIATLQQIVTSACDVELLPRFNEVKRHYKADGSIVTEADLVMQSHLRSALKNAYPDIALLGEEMTSEEQQHLLGSDQAIWCLDPIDGTSNFAAGFPFFCVSLALILEKEIVFGLIYDPIRRECFHAYTGQGAFFNNHPIVISEQVLPLDKTIALIDLKRLSPDLATKLVLERPYASQRNLGSIALELCWIAVGRGHIYLHGQQQLWDYAAAALILNETGLTIKTFDNTPLYDGSLTPKSAISASHPRLFEIWQEAFNQLRGNT